jgi:hypothetical protein
MSVQAQRAMSTTYSGDVTGSNSHIAAPNTNAPGQLESKDLVSGDNTITVPHAGGSASAACTIVMPLVNFSGTDGSTTINSAIFGSAAQAGFTSSDVGKTITGTNIPASTVILSVQSTISVTLSQNATATGSALPFTIYGRPNTTLIKLKGVAADTGVAIHKTDSTSIGLDVSVTTFILNAAAALNGVRLFWA